MSDNPYSPYVDRTNGSTGWGANPTSKRGPQYFPPLPSFKPYQAIMASPGQSGLSAAVARLRTTPVTAATGAGAGSGGAGRGLGPSGTSVQGIAGIQGIPTLGSVAPSLAVGPPDASPPNTAVSPDSTDQAPMTPPDNGGVPPGDQNWSDTGANTVDRPTGGTNTGTYYPATNPAVTRLRGGGGQTGGSRGPLY